MILGLGIPELLIIVVIVMVLFGPKNLPKLGKAFGSTVKNIREGMEGDDKAEEVESETVVEDEDDAEIRELEAKLAAAKAKKEDSAQHAE